MHQSINIADYFTPILQDQFNNRFQYNGSLGFGATSHVEKYQDKLYNKFVAIKRIKKQVIKHFPILILRQSQAKNFDHPNLMKIYECLVIVSEYTKNFVFVTELCQKGSIQTQFQYIKQLPLLNLCQLCLQISNGLKYLHQKQIMHRDLKPQNIFVTESQDGKMLLKIGDYGYSKKVQIENTSWVGTRLYADPQTLSSEYNKNCDIFSLGVIFYQILTGKKLFQSILSLNFQQFEQKKTQIIKSLEEQFEKSSIQNPFIKYITFICFQKEPISTIIQTIKNQISRLQNQGLEDKKEVLITAVSDLQTEKSYLINYDEGRILILNEDQNEEESQDSELHERKQQNESSVKTITNSTISKKIQSNIEIQELPIKSEILKIGSLNQKKVKRKESLTKHQVSFYASTFCLNEKLRKRQIKIEPQQQLSQSIKKFVSRLRSVNEVQHLQMDQGKKNIIKFYIITLNYMFLREWIQKNVKINNVLYQSLQGKLRLMKNLIQPLQQVMVENKDLYDLTVRLKYIISHYQIIYFSNYKEQIIQFMKRNLMRNFNKFNSLLYPQI